MKTTDDTTGPASPRYGRGFRAVSAVLVSAPVLLGACAPAQHASPNAVTASDPSCEEVTSALLERLSAGDSPDELAEHFDEDVDWFIPGDTAVVPWIGRKVGRAGVAEFFTQLGQLAKVEVFEVDTLIGDGDRCVLLGNLRTEVIATGRMIETDFAYDIQVEDGLITRYHMFEDTWAVAEAFEPVSN